jgi:hypothetical protein
MEYRVQAYNTATASENRIHDDAVARRFGFRGGLVPGVDVYAYLTHPIAARFGRAWLERGRVVARVLKPVYDGEEVVISAAGDATLAVEARNPAGELCATAEATLPASAPPLPDLAAFPSRPLPADPPPAGPTSLAPGTLLGTIEGGFHAEQAAAYLADVREALPLYERGRIVHPGYLLRFANFILAVNVRLGPWIHVGSEVQHLGVGGDGDRLVTHGRVTGCYERKGHRFVELDVLVTADDRRPLARIHHTAIYAPRGSLT